VGTDESNLPISNKNLYKPVPAVVAVFAEAEERENNSAMITNSQIREFCGYEFLPHRQICKVVSRILFLKLCVAGIAVVLQRMFLSGINQSYACPQINYGGNIFSELTCCCA
jgi:hypothetical protein